MEIIAHRGYSAEYPENTLLAFRKAFEVGASGIELDARLTSDNVVIIMHDSSVDRTTDGSGEVADLSCAQIRKLDAGAKKGIAFENEPVPTLESVFLELGGKLKINVELANYETKGPDKLVDIVIEMICDLNLKDSVILSSFSFKNLVRAKDLLPDISCGLLAQKGRKGWSSRNILNHSISVDALHPNIADITEKMIKHEHLSRRLVRPWVVNDPHDMMLMQKMGVDGIFTDDPVLGLVYSDSQENEK